MDPFPPDLLPIRFRRSCPQLDAAVWYWCSWQLWTIAAPRYRREHAATVLENWRLMRTTFLEKDYSPAELQRLASAIRRHAVETIRADQAEEARRLTNSRDAFESGRYDRSNVVALRRR